MWRPARVQKDLHPILTALPRGKEERGERRPRGERRGRRGWEWRGDERRGKGKDYLDL